MKRKTAAVCDIKNADNQNKELMHEGVALCVCDSEPGAIDTEIPDEEKPNLDLEKIQKFIDMYTKTKKLEKDWKDYKEEVNDEYENLPGRTPEHA